MHQPTGAGAAGNYKGLLDCLVRVAKEEGVGALYRGLVPRYVCRLWSLGLYVVVRIHQSVRLSGGR